MRHKVKHYVWAVGLALALPLLALAAVSYTGYDYTGTLYGNVMGTATITEAFGINGKGTIVGGFCEDNDPARTVTPGCGPGGDAPSHGYVKIGKDFKLINYPGSFETEAIGLNDAVTIVGLYDPVKPNPPNADAGNGFYCEYPCKDKKNFHKVVYPGATSTDLQAINNEGDMVGVYSLILIPPFTDYGFLMSEGKFCSIDLGENVPGRPYIPGAVDANALGINDEENVVGSYDDPVTGVTGFLLTDVDVPDYVNGKPQPCEWDTLTTFVFPGTGVHQTEAAGINNSGWIVGNYLDDTPNPDTSHAFKVQSNAVGVLDSLSFLNIDFSPLTVGDNAATAINSKGVIVGNFEDDRPPYTTAVPKERAWMRNP